MEHDELEEVIPAGPTGLGLMTPGTRPPPRGDGRTESSVEAAGRGPTNRPRSKMTPNGQRLTSLAMGAENAANGSSEVKVETQQDVGHPSTASGSNSMPCQIGDMLGSYELMELLGQGGMGSVFRARHKVLGRDVAIKVLLPEMSQQPDLVRRFFQEALAINRVHHPNVVEVTDCIFSENRPPYIIMQYLAGQSLARFIQMHAPLAPEVVIELGLQICSAMEAVHARGIVHRDLKPDNVFLIPDPRPDRPDSHIVKLLDFGISKFLSPEDAIVRTRTGATIGTPEYMAPEQINGGKIDRLTDLYSFGAILFEMLSGSPPFAAPQIGQLLLKQLGEPPVAPSTRRPETPHCPIPEELDQAVLACLAKSKDKRVQSMGQLGAIMERVREACSGTAIEKKKTQALETAKRREFWPKRRWPVLVSAGLGAALLVVAVGWFLSTWRRNKGAPMRSAAVGSQLRLSELPAFGMSPATLAVRLASSPASAQPPVVEPVPLPRPETSAVPTQPAEAARHRPDASGSTRKAHRERKRSRPVITTPSMAGDSVTLNPFD